MPLSYVATSKEYCDGKGGTTWKAVRVEPPETSNMIQSGQATDPATCDLKNDPIRAGHRPSGTPPCPVAFYRGIEVDKKGFNILCGGRPHL